MLGFTDKSIITMSLILPSIFGYSINNIYNKFIDLMNLGYKKEEVIHILTKTPQLFGYKMDNIFNKVNYLKSIKLDYLILENPNILIPSKDTIEKRYKYLKSIKQFDIKDLLIKNKDFERKYKK